MLRLERRAPADIARPRDHNVFPGWRSWCTSASPPDAANPATPLTVRVEVTRVHDTTRIRLQGDALWLGGRSEPHAWWRAKSVAEAAVQAGI